MTVKNQPSWLQSAILGVFSIVVTVSTNRMLDSIDTLNSNVHQLNIHFAKVNTQMDAFNEWKVGKNNQDSEQDRHINQLQQTVGIIEERIKAKKDKK